MGEKQWNFRDFFPDMGIFMRKIVIFFFIHELKHMFWVLKRTISLRWGAQKDRFIETVLLSTHNIYFG